MNRAYKYTKLHVFTRFILCYLKKNNCINQGNYHIISFIKSIRLQTYINISDTLIEFKKIEKIIYIIIESVCEKRLKSFTNETRQRLK